MSPTAGAAGARVGRAAFARVPATALAAAARHDDADPVAFALVAALATGEVRRATLGLATGGEASLRLVAVSGQPRIDARRALARRLLERLEAARAVAPDARGTGSVRGAHRGMAFLATALSDEAGGAVVVMLERDGERAFEPGIEASLAGACRDAAVLLLRRARAARPGRARVAALWQAIDSPRLRSAALRRVPAGLRKRVRPRDAALGFAAAAALGLAAVPVPLVVKARATLEAEDRRVVSAADSGHLLAVHARPGDRVARGDLLARFDDREAVGELDAARTDAARVEEELARALATRDRTALAALRADERRLAADVAVAQRRLERAEVRAPFDAVVLKGDPARRLGAPVAAGEALFELGSSERHRLVLEIDEHDVRLVRPGQRARVRLAGAPGSPHAARLGSLLPVAIVETGRGSFRVPATFESAAGSDHPVDGAVLRAGMQGVARVRVGTAPLASAWTRGLRERLTLLAWRLGLLR